MPSSSSASSAELARAFEEGLARAPVSVAFEVEVPASPDRIWEAITRVQRWPRWHRGVDFAILRADEPAPGARLDWKADGMRIRSVIFDVEPERRVAWTLKALGATGAQRWTIGANSGGAAGEMGGAVRATTVRLEEWWTGLAARILRRTLQRTLDVSRAAWLEHLRISMSD